MIKHRNHRQFVIKCNCIDHVIILFIFSSSSYQKKLLIIIPASNKTWYFKTLHLVFRKGNLCWLFAFHICYGKQMQGCFLSLTII